MAVIEEFDYVPLASLHHGPSHPSRVVLPVLPAEATDASADGPSDDPADDGDR